MTDTALFSNLHGVVRGLAIMQSIRLGYLPPIGQGRRLDTAGPTDAQTDMAALEPTSEAAKKAMDELETKFINEINVFRRPNFDNMDLDSAIRMKSVLETDLKIMEADIPRENYEQEGVNHLREHLSALTDYISAKFISGAQSPSTPPASNTGSFLIGLSEGTECVPAVDISRADSGAEANQNFTASSESKPLLNEIALAAYNQISSIVRPKDNSAFIICALSEGAGSGSNTPDASWLA